MNKAILQTNAGTPIQVAVLPTPSASLTGLVYHLTSDDKYYIVAEGQWKVLSVDDYNMLKNLPIINQDLTSTDFTAVEGNYYRHTGSTTENFANGTIYHYQDSEFKELGAGSGTSSAGMQTLVGTLEKPLTIADFEFDIEYLVQGYIIFGEVEHDHIKLNIVSGENLSNKGISFTNGSIVLKQKGYKFTDRDSWRHFLIISNAYMEEADDGESMTYTIFPRHGFYLTVPFRSTDEDGNTLESFSITFTQAGFPFVNGIIGNCDPESGNSAPEEENAFTSGFYAPVEPGEEGQVLNAVENGHYAPTWKDPAIKTVDLSKVKTVSGDYYRHTGDGTKSYRYSLTPLGTLSPDKYRADTFIAIGDSFSDIYFNQNVTPNPMELDWSNVTTDNSDFENLTLIKTENDSIIFSRKLINANYEYCLREGSNGETIWIGEGTLKDGLSDEDKAKLTSNGWNLSEYNWTDNETVTEVNQQNIWNSYMARYSIWYTYRSNFYVNTEIVPNRSTFVLDGDDKIDDTHYLSYGRCGYMSAYKTEGSRINLYVTFFEVYADSKKTNRLYYGLSLGNYENYLQNILYANTTISQEPSVAGLTQWGWQYSEENPVLLDYSWSSSYSGMTPNWENFFSEDNKWATPQNIEKGKIYYCDGNAVLVPLATNNDIQSLVGNINTLLESIDTGAGV